MKWMVKVGVFKIFDLLPFGEAIYYFLQRYGTRSIVPKKQSILQKIEVGLGYLDMIERLAPQLDFHEVVHCEIGSGWSPTIPLLFYTRGIKRQYLCDIRRNLRREIVKDTVRLFKEAIQEASERFSKNCIRIPPSMEPSDSVENYLGKLGMKYFAPYTQQDLLRTNGVNLVSSTQVLLYLNKDQVSNLFNLIARLLRRGGIFVATTHLYDLYSDWDSSISRYNKWRYSDFIWEKIISSRLMKFNRLVASDYKALLEGNGFRILEFNVQKPGLSDLEEFRKVKLHPDFQKIDESELASTHLSFAAWYGG